MTTKKNKLKNKSKNITYKNNSNKTTPSLKVLNNDFILYGAKNKDIGFKILDYTKSNEDKKHKHCLYENISWFAGLEQAKHYKGKNDVIFKWKVVKKLNLIKITSRNSIFFKNIFLKTDKPIKPAIQIKNEYLKSINYQHPYLRMNNNEKCLYEFNFIFGYLSLKQQYDFLLLIKYLIENKFIEILSRHDTNLLPKIIKKIKFFELYPFGIKQKLNRISLYEINKQALLNICMMTYEKYKIDGVYQPNTNSYWYPNLIVYHMNIEEFILFSPHTEVVNDGIV
jgi:hypothetical protein